MKINRLSKYLIIFFPMVMIGCSDPEPSTNDKSKAELEAKKIVAEVRNNPEMHLDSEGERNLDNNKEAKKAFYENMDEISKSKESQAIPVRFPTGERGERIVAYTKMARDGKKEELSKLFNLAKGDAAKLREILSGISRSENRDYLDLVKPFLNDTNPEIKVTAIGAIGKLGTKDDVHLIEPFLNDSNPTIKTFAQMAKSFMK